MNCSPTTRTFIALGRGRLLDVGQHDVGVRAEADEQDRRDRRPDDLQPRVAVDRRAVLELLAGPHPELDRAVERRSSPRARRRAPTRSAGRPTACRSSCPAWTPGPGTSRSSRATAMPMADAIAPIRSICLTAARPSRAGGSSALMALLAHGRGILRERSDRGAGGRQAAARGVQLCVRDRVGSGGRPGSPRAPRRGGGGTPWRTAPAAGSPRGARPHAPSGSGRPASQPRGPCGRA